MSRRSSPLSRPCVLATPATSARAAGWYSRRRPAALVEGGLPTEALLAQVLIAKYGDHLPLYRQSQIYERSGVEVHRATLATWVGQASFHLRPVVDCLKDELKKSDHLGLDETTIRVLDPGRGKTKTGYMWTLVRDERHWSGADPPGVVYRYEPGRGGKYGARLLAGFSGTVQLDAYSGHKILARPDRPGGPVTRALCWGHARRKLKEVYDSSASPIALAGLMQIAKLYAIEEKIRGEPPATRQAIRWAESAPIVNAFGVWLDEQRSKVSPRSRLGEKLTYIAKPVGRAAGVPARRPRRDRLEPGGEPNPPAEAHRQERALRRQRRGCSSLGPHRLADRDLQDERRGALCLDAEHAREDRQGTPAVQNPGTAAVELQARDKVTRALTALPKKSPS